jgi:ABC-2 type transport system ATP-binding protein
MEHVIEIENLTREYRGPRGWFNAVDDLSLTVSAGEVFAFLGRNGAGKTTTIKILLGLTMPTSGRWRILGGKIEDASIRRRIGFLPEEHSFYPHLSVTEVLSFYGNLFGLRGNDLKKAVGNALDLTGLQGRERDKLKFLSKGLVQRVGLAQALINDPDLLILDEPSSGLDPVGVREFRDIVSRIKEQDKTIFLNSHQLSEVEKLADRLGIIDNGKLVRTGKVEELLTGEGGVEVRITPPRDEAVVKRLTGMSVRTWHDEEKGALVILMPDEDSVPEIMAVARDAGSKLISITPKRETLEQFFIETVKDGDTSGGKKGGEG